MESRNRICNPMNKRNFILGLLALPTIGITLTESTESKYILIHKGYYIWTTKQIEDDWNDTYTVGFRDHYSLVVDRLTQSNNTVVFLTRKEDKKTFSNYVKNIGNNELVFNLKEMFL